MPPAMSLYSIARCRRWGHSRWVGQAASSGMVRYGDGFSLDQSRVAYLRYLRRERRQSPRSEAHADHVKVKTEMLRIQIAQKQRVLVEREQADALIDQMAGVVLIHLSGWPARRWPIRSASRRWSSKSDDVDCHETRCERVGGA